jgi:type IV pilus assembly protein PilQ
MSTRKRLLPAFVFAVLLARGLGQPAPATPPEASTATPPAATPPPAAAPVSDVAIKDTGPAHPAIATKGKDAFGKDTLSVDFPDEEISNILRNVADLFELNIVIPPSLQGKASIKLRDVSWRQIFQNVLQPVGYTYIEDGNIIKIVSNETLLQEPVSTEVFLINYARASDILTTVTSLVDAAAGGKIVVDARSNSLVITERPSRMNRIRPIIEQLDRATDQVMIESKFVEVTDRDVKNIGVNWSSLAAYNVSVGAGGENGRFATVQRNRGQTASAGTNGSNTQSSGVTGSSNNGTSATQSSGSNNSISVTSTNGVTTALSSTGTNGAITNTATASTANGVSNDVSNSLNLLQSLTNTNDTSRTLSAVFSADQFKLILSALQTLNTTKVVSNPTIVTLNNTEATINVGEERPIPRYSYNDQKGSFEVNGFDFKPIGVLLKVTPQVNSRGFIKLTLAPEVSQTNGSVVFGGASGTEIPIIASRKATTQVSLKDGFTMGIGGLLTTNATKGQTKVPILGSLPLLGRLFRSDSKDTTTTNLIIFITAKSVSAEGASVEQVFDSSRVRQLGMRREDLPGYRDGSDPYLKDPPPEESGKGKSKAKSANDAQ